MVVREINRIKFQFLIGPRLNACHILNKDIVIVTQNVVIDPGTIVCVQSSSVYIIELTVVRITDITGIRINQPCHPLSHQSQHLICDIGLLFVILAESRLINSRLYGKVNIGEVIRSRNHLVMYLICCIERENREFFTIVECLERLFIFCQRSFIRRHHSYCKIIPVIGLRLFYQIRLIGIMQGPGGIHPVGFKLLALLTPQQVQNIFLNTVGKFFQFAGFFRISSQFIKLGSRIRCSPHICIFSMNLPGSNAACTIH